MACPPSLSFPASSWLIQKVRLHVHCPSLFMFILVSWALFTLLLSCLFWFLFGFIMHIYDLSQRESGTTQGSLSYCGCLTLAGCQVSTKAHPSLLSSREKRRNTMKGLWVETRTGTDLSLILLLRASKLDLGKLIEFIINQNQCRLMKSKTSF